MAGGFRVESNGFATVIGPVSTGSLESLQKLSFSRLHS